VLAVTETTVNLDLPSNSKVERRVSRQHIEKVPKDDFNRALPEPELIEAEEAYEVEAIIGERLYGKNKERQFKVKWQNWAINHASWEPELRLQEDMDPATLQKMIEDYRTGKTEATAQ
jgi:hypothetical protein